MEEVEEVTNSSGPLAGRTVAAQTATVAAGSMTPFFFRPCWVQCKTAFVQVWCLARKRGFEQVMQLYFKGGTKQSPGQA